MLAHGRDLKDIGKLKERLEKAEKLKSGFSPANYLRRCLHKAEEAHKKPCAEQCKKEYQAYVEHWKEQDRLLAERECEEAAMHSSKCLIHPRFRKAILEYIANHPGTRFHPSWTQAK